MVSGTSPSAFPTSVIILTCFFIVIATQAGTSTGSIQTMLHSQKQRQKLSRINPTCLLNCAQCVKIYGDYFDGYACAQTCKLVLPFKKSVSAREPVPVNYYYPWNKRAREAAEAEDNDRDHQEAELEFDSEGGMHVPKIDCADIETIGRFIRN